MLQFSEIEKRRALAGIEQKVLAAKAGLHPQSYSKLKKPSKHGATENTLKKLSAALVDLEAEKGKGNE